MTGQAARIRLLQGMSIFGGMSPAALSLVLERSAAVAVPEGDYFFREGDRGASTYALEQGRVAILKRWHGAEWELHQLRPGDCFGEVALVDFGPRSASVRALEDCRALEIAPPLLRALRDLDLEQFTLIYMNMARELSRRLRAADARLFRLGVEAGDVAGWGAPAT
jgi:CRP/FNR family transcriptional regulator, cyclic AMP receptor protein